MLNMKKWLCAVRTRNMRRAAHPPLIKDVVDAAEKAAVDVGLEAAEDVDVLPIAEGPKKKRGAGRKGAGSSAQRRARPKSDSE